MIGVWPVLTGSGTWVHYALPGAERTVCGSRVARDAPEFEGGGRAASCHRCLRWASQRRVLVLEPGAAGTGWTA